MADGTLHGIHTIEGSIRRGVSLEETNTGGENSLMLAVKAGKRDIVLALLGKRININAVDQRGFGVLDHAVNHGDKDIICILLAHGTESAIKIKRGIRHSTLFCR